MKLFKVLGLVLLGLYVSPANAGCKYNIKYTIVDGSGGFNINPSWVSSGETVRFVKNSECNAFVAQVKSGNVVVKGEGGNRCRLKIGSYDRSVKLVNAKDLMQDKSPGAFIPNCSHVKRFGATF
jgi:hypothetical protein